MVVFYGRIRRDGDCYAVEIPATVVESLGLTTGQQVQLQIRPAEDAASFPDDLRVAFSTEMERGKDALRYLARDDAGLAPHAQT